MCAACSSAAVNIAFEVGHEHQERFLLLAYPLLRLVVRLEFFAIATIRTVRRLVDANAAFDVCSAADPVLRTRSALPSVCASGTRAQQACFHVLKSPWDRPQNLLQRVRLQ